MKGMTKEDWEAFDNARWEHEQEMKAQADASAYADYLANLESELECREMNEWELTEEEQDEIPFWRAGDSGQPHYDKATIGRAYQKKLLEYVDGRCVDHLLNLTGFEITDPPRPIYRTVDGYYHLHRYDCPQCRQELKKAFDL